MNQKIINFHNSRRFSIRNEVQVTVAFTENRTVLLISYQPSNIKQLCSRAVWLEKGTILAQGKPDEVVKFYETNVHKYTT
jgi:ABC-type polysaccharide/polyol phosphate transport system ATPase subunit